MARLTTKARKKISPKDFALPGRRYPIEDASHARNALARVAQHGSPAEKATVRADVHRTYPGIEEARKKPMGKTKDDEKRNGERNAAKHKPHDAIGAHEGRTLVPDRTSKKK